jgi:hypothetical protein
MRRELVVICVWSVALASCKGKSKDHGPGSSVGSSAGSSVASTGSAGAAGSATAWVHPPLHDAGVPIAVDWPRCGKALRKAATEPLDVRPATVIDGCRVCGDWTPLLHWNTPQTDKGPTRLEIEQAMAACGYCSANAKQRFLGTLDNARGTNTRTPWRMLGEQCKEAVSAVPDNRFTSAPFYALDRIARAASQQGGEIANLLAAIELPLPAVSITGTGIVLPDVEVPVNPTAGPIALTLLAEGIHVAKLPRAHLGASGVLVDLGNYPGDDVKLADLGKVLTKLIAGDKTQTIAILAPLAMPADSLVSIVAAASKVAPVYLAANAPGAPEGWELPGTIPVALETGGKSSFTITPEMTIQSVATELAKRGASGAKKVSLATGTAGGPKR